MLNRTAMARRIMREIPGLRLSQAYQMVHLVAMEICNGLSEGQEVKNQRFRGLQASRSEAAAAQIAEWGLGDDRDRANRQIQAA